MSPPPASTPLAKPYHDFVRLLEPAVRGAARLVRALEGRVANVPKSHETTAAKQALTEADTQAQEMILDALHQHFPGVCVAAEEDTPGVARFPIESDAQVVIDPIDGTLHSFLESRGPYGTMVGLVVDGRYEAGLVALPREGLLFAAIRGEGAYRARVAGPLRPVAAAADGDRVLVTHGTPKRVQAHLENEGFEVIPACGGAIAVAPLIVGVRAGLRWSQNDGIGISIRGRIGVLIASEAGAFTCRQEGDSFPLDQTTRAATLLVAAREEDLGILESALDAAD
jgi:fructose-1,6-bisphosphatase/inositol monophosphatase family enzyme